ncbi:MAG: hypothetical protein H6587_01710 [Flavobacteriales bacterium]|nr:hypothetical protein [Flavobacteriales bacterium]MCB9363261.1 hypothetical protein [Flavobacteriales bacterium]
MKINKFNLFDYLYYRTFLFYKEAERKEGLGSNKDRGVFLVATCLSFNLISILSILDYFFFKIDNNTVTYVYVGCYIIINLICLYVFEVRRHDMILLKYEKESESQKENRGVIVLSYVFISFFIFIALYFLD